MKGGIQGKESQALSHEGCLHPTVGRWSVPTPFMLGLKEESLINKLNQWKDLTLERIKMLDIWLFPI